MPVGCKQVDLPIELLNEPFTLEDNHKRILKIRDYRELFSFEMTNTGIKFKIGVQTWEIVVEVNPLLSKTKTNVSVIAIYDNYGLSITYEFLRHLHESKGRHQFWNPAWISCYLDAALLILKPGINVNLSSLSGLDEIATKCSYLLAELSYIDSLAPKATEELVQSSIHLPIELLSLITQNPTLSKGIAEQMMTDECTP